MSPKMGVLWVALIMLKGLWLSVQNPSLQAGICGWWRALEAVGVFTPENTYYAAAHSLPTTPPLSEEENQK